MDLHDYGICTTYVKALIDHCRCQLIQKATPNDMLGTSLSQYDTLVEAQIKYHACLRKGVGKHVTKYDFHRVDAP